MPFISCPTTEYYKNLANNHPGGEKTNLVDDWVDPSGFNPGHDGCSHLTPVRRSGGAQRNPTNIAYGWEDEKKILNQVKFN